MSAPPPVPALPDSERRTAYSITAQTGPFSVNFALYGDGADYAEWIEVWLNGVQVSFALTSPSGSLGTLPRPITDAVISLGSAGTGTLEIVGARRPRRTSQFAENRGVTARDLNQVFTDVIAQNREDWDRRTRVSAAPAGETIGQLPSAASRANKFFAFDPAGQPVMLFPPSFVGTSSFVSLPQFGAIGDNATDNTTAIQNCMNSGAPAIYVPEGMFKCNHIDIPSTVLKFWGPGTLVANGSLAAFAAWFRAASPASGLSIDEITFLASAAYNTNGLLDLIGGVNGRIQNCKFNGGRFSAQIEASGHLIIANNEMISFAQSAIEATGANDTLAILHNNVSNPAATGTIFNVGEAGTDSNDCAIIGNSIFGGTIFGIHVHQMQRGKIALNTVRETTLEAISIGGASEDTLVAHNTARWETAGTDVGMSFGGDDSTHKCKRIVFDDNIVVRADKGGVLAADFSEDCVLRDNQLMDCNRSNGASSPSGINLSGTACLRTTIINNIASNASGGHMDYCVSEDGGGSVPDFSYIANNYGRSMATGVAFKTGANSVLAGNVALP